MSLPVLPITFEPVTERPGSFGFFATSNDITPQLDGRMPVGVQWNQRLPLGVWDEGNLADVTVVAGEIQTTLSSYNLPLRLAKTDGGDTDTLPDCLAEAIPFRYELRQTADLLEATGDELSDELVNRVVRAHDIAFAYSLAQRLAVDPVTVAAGRTANAADAIAIVDDALMSAGIYGGVIHVPGYLSARVKADLDDDRSTWNGTRLHFMPSAAAGGSGLIYGTGPVKYARAADRITTVHGDGDAPPVGEMNWSRNEWFSQGVFFGLTAFDGPAYVIQSDDIDGITTLTA